MILNDVEVSNIMSEFPNIKLSYENIVHNKVYDSDFMITIPEGKKYFVWFSIYRNQNVCYLLEIESDKGISSIKIVNACFNDDLCYGIGTIFYGTLFIYNNSKIFNIQDIYYYKGKQIRTMSETLKIYQHIFIIDIKQIVYNSNFILFGLPLMSYNLTDLLHKIELLPYSIQYIQYRYFKKTEIYNVKYVKPNNQYIKQSEFVFKIKAELQNDIYNLYVYSKITGNSNYFYDTAYIPDYKTSVMMNKLFRKIKENINLDALEESDSEDEFENERIDKYVFLEKVVYMVCAYNIKFKKWVPLRLANKEEKLVELSVLQ
jgi:hypothetical protein